MAGAIFAIDQVRPGGTSFGTPNVPRKDLWIGRDIHPVIASPPNVSYLWELLDVARGSTNVLSGATTATPVFTIDAYGSYRLRCTTNGGGAGNVSTQVFVARFDLNGVLQRHGRYRPAFGETDAEDDFDGSGRGYAPAFEEIEEDTRVRIEALEAAVAALGGGSAQSFGNVSDVAAAETYPVVGLQDTSWLMVRSVHRLFELVTATAVPNHDTILSTPTAGRYWMEWT